MPNSALPLREIEEAQCALKRSIFEAEQLTRESERLIRENELLTHGQDNDLFDRVDDPA